MKFSFIQWMPDKNLVIALGAGVLSVIVSSLMNLTESEILRIIIRQFIQVIGIGLVLPFFIFHNSGEFRKASIRLDHPLRYILISTVLTIPLFFIMVKDIGLANIRITDLAQIEGILYVMVTNIAEVLFFACFIRYSVEKSFGLIPGIMIAAAFFSLHHAGFQPEYGKLFLVGLAFISIVRIANHWLIAFPLWWVGGVFDVMFGSEATESVNWAGFTPYSLMILVVVIGLFTFKYVDSPELRCNEGR